MVINAEGKKKTKRKTGKDVKKMAVILRRYISIPSSG